MAESSKTHHFIPVIIFPSKVTNISILISFTIRMIKAYTTLLMIFVLHCACGDSKCNISRTDCVEVSGHAFYGVTDTWTASDSRYTELLNILFLIVLGLICSFVCSLCLISYGYAYVMLAEFPKLFPNMVLGNNVCNMIKNPADPGSLFNKPEDHVYNILQVGTGYNNSYGTEHPKGIYVLVEESEFQELNNIEHRTVIQHGQKRGIKVGDIGGNISTYTSFEISAKDLIRKWRYLYLLPSSFSCENRVLKVVVAGIVSVNFIYCNSALWKVYVDVADVTLDLQYATALDNGSLISINVTRNSMANDMILVVGFIGAITFSFYSFGTFMILGYSRKDKAARKLLEPLVSGIKIISEDFSELFIEYFFVDIYSFGDGISYIILSKVVLTVLMHGISGLKSLFSLNSDYKMVKESKGSTLKISYPTLFKNSICNVEDKEVIIGNKLIVSFVVSTFLKILFSFIVLIRAFGVIYHRYATVYIPENCFQVKDGRLVQTPFDWNCMNRIDRTLFALYCFPVLVLLVVFLYITVFKTLISPCFKKIRSYYNGSGYYINDRYEYYHKVAGDVGTHDVRINGSFKVKNKERLNEKFSYKPSFKRNKHFEETLV